MIKVTQSSKDVAQEKRDPANRSPEVRGSRAATARMPAVAEAQVPNPPAASTTAAAAPLAQAVQRQADWARAFGGANEAENLQRASTILRWRPGSEDPKATHEAAARGTSGAGSAVPFLAQIQRSFGQHDVSGVRAYTGEVATEAAESMGASAYTAGNRIAFAGTPSLHTAAHEAAHTVQQRAGVQLEGGVGKVGDPYEQHADAVADAVVAGRSAEALLDAAPGGAGSSRPTLENVAKKANPAWEGIRGSRPQGQSPMVQRVTKREVEALALSLTREKSLSLPQIEHIEEVIKNKMITEGLWNEKTLTLWKQKALKEMSKVYFKGWIGDIRALLVADSPAAASPIAKRFKPTESDITAYKDAIGVPQGFYYVIDSESEAKGLFTIGANPCSAIALYAENTKSKKEVYAVAHIDSANRIEDLIVGMLDAMKTKGGGELGTIEGIVSSAHISEKGLSDLKEEKDLAAMSKVESLKGDTFKYVIPLLQKHGVEISAIGDRGELWMGRGYKAGAGAGTAAKGGGIKTMPADSIGPLAKSKESAAGVISGIKACLEMQEEQKVSGISVESETRIIESVKTGMNRAMEEFLDAAKALAEKHAPGLDELKDFIKLNKDEIAKSPEGEKLVEWAA